VGALRIDRERLAGLGDWLIALLLAGAAEYEIWVSSLDPDGVPEPHAVHAVFVLLATLPLAWRRRAPLAVLFTVLAASTVESVAFASFPSFEPFLALIIAVYSVGAHCERRQALIGGGVTFALLFFGDLAHSLAADGSFNVGAVVVCAAAWVVGRALRRWRLEAVELGRRAGRLERESDERARLAAAEERARIARELHDVVAHAVSVIVVQAQGAQRVLVGEQEPVRDALGSIEASGRQALVELRRMLGVLRRGDEELALTPQASLRHLDGLVEHVREAGMLVELRIEGDPEPLPPGVDVSAYRIVQEALTNALKHAGPARASVVVRYGPEELELEISDDGRSSGKGDGTGHGLVGMRERVAVVGGVLESGARPGGGFVVRARLPHEATVA
jgi:signal transduction histidine kinase